MKPSPILEVSSALISAVAASAVAFFAMSIFGYGGIVSLAGLILLGVVFGAVYLLLRSPLAWVCFGFPFSGLLGYVAFDSWSHPGRAMDWPVLIVGCLGFASVYTGFHRAMRDSRQVRSRRGKSESGG